MMTKEEARQSKNKSHKKWREKNPSYSSDYKVKRRKSDPKWLESSRKYNAEFMKKFNKKHPDKVRNTKLKQKYNINLEEYTNIFNQQEGRCDICGEGFPYIIGKLVHVDHCHKNNKVRGLLCNKCNSILGFAGDRIDVLILAATYLLKHY